MRSGKKPAWWSRRLYVLLTLVAVLALGAVAAVLLHERAPVKDLPPTAEAVPISPGVTPSSEATEAVPAAEPGQGGEDQTTTSPKEVAPPVVASEPARDPERTAPLEVAAPAGIPVGNQAGQAAPDFALLGLHGGGITLSDLRGRVVILDFWASWCAPCRASMPSLEALAARHREAGVVLVGVSLDRTAEDAIDYLATSGSKELVAVWGSLSAAREVARRYGIFGIPHTFVIDRQGIVRFSDHPVRLSDSTLEPWL